MDHYSHGPFIFERNNVDFPYNSKIGNGYNTLFSLCYHIAALK